MVSDYILSGLKSVARKCRQMLSEGFLGTTAASDSAEPSWMPLGRLTTMDSPCRRLWA